MLSKSNLNLLIIALKTDSNKPLHLGILQGIRYESWSMLYNVQNPDSYKIYDIMNINATEVPALTPM